MIFNALPSLRNVVRPCDFSNVIKTIVAKDYANTNYTTTWTATKDCWLHCYMQKASDGNSYTFGELYIDGVLVYDLNDHDDSGSASGEHTIVPALYVKKGTVIKINGIYTVLNVYGCIR